MGHSRTTAYENQQLLKVSASGFRAASAAERYGMYGQRQHDTDSKVLKVPAVSSDFTPFSLLGTTRVGREGAARKNIQSPLV